MRFVDRVRVFVSGGDGGPGAVAWRREAHVPAGGPAGGDGGRGGSVLLVADDSMSTLLDLKYRQHHRAKDGGKGGTRGMNGRGAEDIVVHVPVGTSVFFEGLADDPSERPWSEDAEAQEFSMENVYVVGDDEFVPVDGGGLFGEEGLANVDQPIHTSPILHARENEPLDLERGQLLGDLTDPGQELLVARGGRGGRGNVHFKTSTNRAPDRSEPGGKGDTLWLRLELKLLADIGVVGFPNVGKSTLIRAVSRARPEVGAYPFTTLTPHLGVVELSDHRSFVIADVPGLVRGASQGRGLGHQFLRHLERTRVLLHVLAPDPEEGREPLADLDALEHELNAYGDMFSGRPRVVALNKIDTDEGRELVRETKKRLRARNIPLFPICAATGEGTEALLEALWRRLRLLKERESQASWRR